VLYSNVTVVLRLKATAVGGRLVSRPYIIHNGVIFARVDVKKSLFKPSYDTGNATDR
jgi:hypothetical protein